MSLRDRPLRSSVAASETDDVERLKRELETLHQLGQALAVSLDAPEVLERSLHILLDQGWFACGDALVRRAGEFDVVATRSCPYTDTTECPSLKTMHQGAQSALEQQQVLLIEGRHLVPLGRFAVLILTGGTPSRTFLEAVIDLICASLKRAELNHRLATKERQRSRLLQALMTAQEEERIRISRDLHDLIGQALTAILLGLDKALERPDPAELQKLKELTSLTLADVRRIALDLRPSVLDELGLEAALRRYTRHLSERNELNIAALVSLPERLERRVEIALYRVAQEALTNVVRHSRASNASVVVTHPNSHVQMVVEDDGIGFDPAALLTPEQLGLLGMRERLELLGGTLHIDTAPGRGCTVHARLPARKA